MRVSGVRQPCPTTLVSGAGFRSRGEKGMLYKFINELFSQLMNVYMRQGWVRQKS